LQPGDWVARWWRTEDWIARVQGSLILYAANGDCTPFERTMTALLDLAKT